MTNSFVIVKLLARPSHKTPIFLISAHVVDSQKPYSGGLHCLVEVADIVTQSLGVKGKLNDDCILN